ncbi:hypothetical protein Vadar_026362 [Vaccinium darrowii]|uniref:Uncharacterized protein n=1 Tax=Vaccinium darrowii TaxID=229202 RepID=A0ACB7ZN24_9ERIC|nr:hypothetical protein Vadar_026362 [Vaccinium darrowii]
MEFKAPTNHHLLLLLLRLILVLELANLSFAMATIADNGNGNTGEHAGERVEFNAFPSAAASKEVLKTGEQLVAENDKQYWGAEFQCQCPPSAYECPLTLEPEAFKQLKNNLGPVIRQRLRELLKKALTVESAIDAAHTIDLLKLLNESNTELNIVGENMQNGAQQLRDAVLKIPEIM